MSSLDKFGDLLQNACSRPGFKVTFRGKFLVGVEMQSSQVLNNLNASNCLCSCMISSEVNLLANPDEALQKATFEC